jgi:hypothetical protein
LCESRNLQFVCGVRQDIKGEIQLKTDVGTAEDLCQQ